MTKLEMIARAICEASGENGKWWKNYERTARAAIEALMEPTPEMLNIQICPQPAGPYILSNPMYGPRRAIYQAMLGKVLEDKG